MPTSCHSVQNIFHATWYLSRLKCMSTNSQIYLLISWMWHLVFQVKERQTEGADYCLLGCHASVTKISEEYVTPFFRVAILVMDYQITCHINHKKIIFIVTTLRNLKFRGDCTERICLCKQCWIEVHLRTHSEEITEGKHLKFLLLVVY
jgi:hypothetical protein